MLKGLNVIGVISKVIPVPKKENKKIVAYEILDGMYRFCYRFIPSAKAAIEMNRGEMYYGNSVKENFHAFMGSVFEDMCCFYTLFQGEEDGRGLKCLVTNASRWWGPGHDHMPTDIDVVGIDDTEKKAVIGECKFRNDVIDKEICEALMDKTGLIDKHYKEVEYLFFALSGYSKWVRENADPDKVRLLAIDDLYAI